MLVKKLQWTFSSIETSRTEAEGPWQMEKNAECVQREN